MSTTVERMKRGKTERETCDLNGWGIGTVVRGWEQWGKDRGVWTTWRITALGESMVLARTILSEIRESDGSFTTDDRDRREHTVTFTCREWAEVTTEPTR